MSLSPGRFILALVIVAIPVAVLEESDKRAAMALAFLIVLSFVVFNSQGLRQFAAFVGRELKK